MALAAVVRDVDALIEMRVAGALDLARLPMTDLGNAERFVERFGNDFRYTTAKGWLGWDGRRWRVLDQEDKVTPAEVQEAVFRTVRCIQDEAAAVRETGICNPHDYPKWCKDNIDRAHVNVDEGFDRIIEKGSRITLLSDELAKHGRTSEASGKLGCIPNLAKRWLTVPIEEFDVDPDAINVLNGTVRFRKGADGLWSASLCAHEKTDMITRLAPVDFDPDAPAPIYDAMMEWAQPEEDRRRYLHQWGGYSITGHTGEQKLQFWYGKGANGKSTVIDAWAHAAGDYAGSIGIESFLDQGIKRRGDAATPDLARLGGVRLLRASEPERGARLNEALIKAATGGEPMAVRALNKGFFDLVPRFKLTIGGNYRPEIPGTDEGIWRRVKLVPWESFLEESARDDKMPEKLRGEAAGIFARLVLGVVDWMNNGLVEPESVKAATAEYRDHSDPLARFLRGCVEAEAGARIQSSRLFDVFIAWCKAAGEREWSQKGFGAAMIDKGFRKKQSNGMQWLDIKLIKSVSDFIDPATGKVIELDDREEWVVSPVSAAPQYDPDQDIDPL